MIQRRRLLLMRHGDVSYFDAAGEPVPPDTVPLTPAGEAQARAAGRWLAAQPIDRVITSGLVRTEATARLALQAAGIALEPQAVAALREIRGGRPAPGGAPPDLTTAFAGPVALDARFMGGESVGELLARSLPALEALLAAPDWDTALLVLHGAVNRGLISWFLTGRPAFLGGIEQDPGCINVIDVGARPSEAIVRLVNYCPDRDAPPESRLSTIEHLQHQFAQFSLRGPA